MENRNNATNLLIAGAVIFALYKFGDGIANLFGGGSKKTEADNLYTDRETDAYSDPWSPQYLQSRLQGGGNKKYHVITGANVLKLLKIITDTGGFWRIKPETGNTLLEAFATLKHKTQVSYLSMQFQKKYGKDLLTYIKSKLQTVGWMSAEKRNENFAALVRYVNKLPE